jgi:hypothetical protein
MVFLVAQFAKTNEHQMKRSSRAQSSGPTSVRRRRDPEVACRLAESRERSLLALLEHVVEHLMDNQA